MSACSASIFCRSPIPAWGGKKALFGTDPVAGVFPRKQGDPIVVDLALTTVVRGKIMMAMRKGEKIPEGWALDRHGKPTTDPKEAIEHGSLFPVGGAKGAMLALMFELICAALTGSAIGPEADSFFAEEGNKPRIGQAFIAVDPSALAGMDRFYQRVETVVAAMLADDGVRLPGARRFASEKKSRDGIEVPDDLLAYDVTVDFPKMKVAVATRDARVVGIRYLPLETASIAAKNSLAEKAARQLERYREDPDAKFDLPLLIEGSAFQKGVWNTMCAIPRGRTRTYGELAKELGDGTFETARAVGQACGDNRLPIVIPCHRVVAANGIGGFSHSTEGYLIEVKRWLLAHEIRPEEFALRP